MQKPGARGNSPRVFFSMRFKLPRFLRSEAVGRDRAQLPGFETIELSQVGIAQGDSERAVGLAVDARRESVLAVTDQLDHGGVQKQVNAEFLLRSEERRVGKECRSRGSADQ